MKAAAQKALLVVALVKKALLLLLIVGNAQGEDGVRSEDFMKRYPGGAQDGACYLLRLEGCNIIAVENDYAAPAEIALIFVQHEEQKKALAVAEKLANDLPGKCSAAPFMGDCGAAVVYCPISGLADKSPLLPILAPVSDCRNTLFVGWQGKRVRARINMTAQADGNSPRKKAKAATVEIAVAPAERSLECAEFRLIKGKLSQDELCRFISTRMRGSASANLPPASANVKKELKTSYDNQDILAYSSFSNFCIVSKGKVYRAGTTDGVRKAILSAKREKLAFRFPSQETLWPNKLSQQDPETDKQEQQQQQKVIVISLQKATIYRGLGVSNSFIHCARDKYDEDASAPSPVQAYALYLEKLRKK